MCVLKWWKSSVPYLDCCKTSTAEQPTESVHIDLDVIECLAHNSNLSQNTEGREQMHYN